ncbi:putative gustatory receptor 28a [Calliopsis andreniformis]|uniref:putative gustatory receptor 28a n=1 Tax=Calliopsis andreniformis TaxID=337506 RepID=UPI003FCD7650
MFRLNRDVCSMYSGKLIASDNSTCSLPSLKFISYYDKLSELKMELPQRSPKYLRKSVLPKTENYMKPFDVETTFAEVTLEKKNRAKKYRGPDSPLYSAIYPIACITKVFGLSPYDFTGDRMTPSNIFLIFSYVFLILYTYIMYTVFSRFVNMKRQKQIRSVVETTKVTVNYLVAMYEIIWTMLKRRTFAQIWNAVQDIDEKLDRLGYPMNERPTRIAVWILLITQTILWIAINQSGMYAWSEIWRFNVGYMIMYVGTAASVYKCSCMVIFIGRRFHRLNQMTKENLPPRVGYKSTTVSRKTIQNLHNELMSIGEAINAYYSWSLLFWLGNLSVHSVSNVYFIIDWIILTSWSTIRWTAILNMSFWLVAFIMQLLTLHIGCDYAMDEANSMGALFVEWDARIIRRFPHDNTARISLHFLNRRLSLSAGGLFNVNLSLLCSVIGVLSTYLIILLQFPS